MVYIPAFWIIFLSIGMAIKWLFCARNGDPFQGPRVGSCLTLRNVQGDTCADEARDFTGKGPGGEQQEGTQEDCSAMRLAVSAFMVMGLVSRLSLTNHSDTGSFLVVCTALSQEVFKWERVWEVGRTYGLESSLSFWLFSDSSFGGSLLVLYSLLGPPI